MILRLYSGVMKFSAPALNALLRRRARCGKEDPARLDERRGIASRPRPEGTLIWCHAASVGEAQSLLALIPPLCADGARLLVTTGTVTSARLMAARLPPGAFHQYVPLDHPAWVARFLDHWRPNLAVWVESELWPNLIGTVKARGIPAALINARMSERSFRRWRLAPRAAAEVFSAFALCRAQDEDESARLQALGGRNVRAVPNLKYAADPLPADATALADLQAALGERPRLLWASTHAGEDDIALRLHARLAPAHPGLLTILLPRHPERGEVIAIAAAAANLPVRRRGDLHILPRAGDAVYIADTLGETGIFYRAVKTCIIGGSFVPVGGHNPIEPAHFGCSLVFGPHMFNFSAIVRDFIRENAAIAVRGEEEAFGVLSRALAGDAAVRDRARRARDWVARTGNTAEALTAELLPLMRKARTS